jgi:hypothetical protein
MMTLGIDGSVARVMWIQWIDSSMNNLISDHDIMYFQRNELYLYFTVGGTQLTHGSGVGR